MVQVPQTAYGTADSWDKSTSTGQPGRAGPWSERTERDGCNMKPMMIIGIVLIVLGVAGLVFQGITYTTREKVVDLPGLQVTAEKEKTIPIPAIVGGLALAGGVAVVLVAAKKKS